MNLRPIPIPSLILKVFGCLYLCLLCSPSIGQDTTQARIWWKQARAFEKKYQLDSCVKYYHLSANRHFQTAKVYQDTNYWKRGILSKGRYCLSLHRMKYYSKSIKVLLDLIPIIEEELHPHHVYKGDLYTLLGSSYGAQRNFERSLFYKKKALEVYQRNPEKNRELIAASYNNIAAAHLNNREDGLALNMFWRSLEAYNYTGSAVKTIYSNIAGIYYLRNQHQKALSFQNKALSLCDPKKHKRFLQRLYLKIARTHSATGNYTRANLFYEQSLDLAISLYGPNTLQASEIYSGWAYSYQDQKLLDKSEELLKKAIAIESAFPDPNLYKIAVLYRDLGSTYQFQQKNQKGIEVTKQSLRLFQDFEFADGYDIGITHLNISEKYRKLSQYEPALFHVQEGIKHLHKKFGETNTYLRDAYHLLNLVHYESKQYNEALNALTRAHDIGHQLEDTVNEEMLQIYWDIGNIHLVQGDLSASFSWFQQAIDLFDRLKKETMESSTQALIQEENHELFVEAIQALYQMANRFPDSSFLHRSFEYSEKARNAILSKQINAAFALGNSKIPDHLLNQENMLRLNVQYFIKRLREARLSEQEDSARISRYQDSLFFYQQTHDSILNNLEKEFPAYYRLKYDQRVKSVQKIQKSLAPDQGLVQYLLGDTSLFAWVITQDSFWIRKLPRDRLLEKNIEYFLQSIYACPAGIDCDESDTKQDRIFLAHHLYQQLIAPLNELLPDRLVLVPDGILGYLPFEALVSEPSTNSSVYQPQYWIEDKTISYAFSSTLWNEMKEQRHAEHPSNTLLAMAPDFSDVSLNIQQLADKQSFRGGFFGPLLHSGREVDSIQRIIGGLSLVDTQATLSNFQQLAPQFRILHLATHGKVLPDPKYSLLAFYGPQDSVFLNDTIQKGISALYLSDLYTLELNADLVVLSACETGIGKLYRGEGIASLARGFTYAGAKSIVPSLWSVNDQSTAFLMQRFYQYLADGKPKDVALRQAKLDLIDEGQSHPFHWAAFVLMGDESPIEFSRSYTGYWIAAGVMILFLLGLLFWQKQREVA